MPSLAVIGHLSRDVVAGASPRVGGGPWHAARALAALGADAVVIAACGTEDEDAFRAELAATGVPFELHARGQTTAFSFSYDAAGTRTMTVDAIGEPFAPEVDAEWVQVAPLLRGDVVVPRAPHVLLDGQGLVRRPALGPLELDAAFDPELLRGVSILKLSDEEAAVVGAASTCRSSSSRTACAARRSNGTHIPAEPVDADPTGAGDMFAAGYLAARAGGAEPVEAGRSASGARVGNPFVVIAAVGTVAGVFLVDVEDESLLGDGTEVPAADVPEIGLPRVVAAAQCGSTVIAVVERRPPLMLSNDGGATWREAGGGLPPGFAVAIADDDPDRMLYAARNRLYVSANGGVFWRSLPFELPDIDSVAWID